MTRSNLRWKKIQLVYSPCCRGRNTNSQTQTCTISGLIRALLEYKAGLLSSAGIMIKFNCGDSCHQMFLSDLFHPTPTCDTVVTTYTRYKINQNKTDQLKSNQVLELESE